MRCHGVAPTSPPAAAARSGRRRQPGRTQAGLRAQAGRCVNTCTDASRSYTCMAAMTALLLLHGHTPARYHTCFDIGPWREPVSSILPFPPPSIQKVDNLANVEVTPRRWQGWQQQQVHEHGGGAACRAASIATAAGRRHGTGAFSRMCACPERAGNWLTTKITERE